MPRAVGRDEVRTLVARGAQLVEVLPGEEFRDEHLPGAINIPIRKIEEDDGRYKVTVLTPDRHKGKLSISPHSGEIIARDRNNDDN